MTASRRCDVVVVGAGPAGLAAACLIAEAGLAVTVLAGEAAPAGDDPRTVALMQPSIRLIAHLGLWPGNLQPLSAPLWKLRLVDDTGSLLAPGPATFDARELGPEPFGWNIPIASLMGALDAKARALGAAVVADQASRLQTSPSAALVSTAGGDAISAKAVVGADGRASFIRAAATIGTVEWSYDQTALAASFDHTIAHRDTSIEYHKPAGPLTTVPLPGQRSSLVWLERPERARVLFTIPEDEFARVLQAEMHGDLGLVSAVGRRALFPMQGLTAVAFARNRVLLVGEAAHVLPPVGAQGLNLSLRDAATAAEIITNAARFGDDIGSRDVMERYDRLRRRDVLPRQGVVDAVNRSLLSGAMLPNEARSLGLALAARIGPLRRRIMLEGIAPADLPRLMRG